MKILADPGISQAEAAFSTLGMVELLPGREWTPTAVAQADAIFVRSVTRVDETLLAGSPVKFVGTATSGLEHIDIDYLQSHGIGFADAHGGNANAVAEYVVGAVLCWTARRGQTTEGLRAGVVGAGAIGSRVATKLSALGMQCLCNDPPLAECLPKKEFVTLEQALTADVISLHVPLTGEGEYPTRGLIAADQLAACHESSCIINAARGGIVDEVALLRSLKSQAHRYAVMDCWENEPAISEPLLEAAQLTTAHIAGHSLDGKLAGTAMIYEAACRFFETAPVWKPFISSDQNEVIELTDLDESDEAIIRALVIQCFDVERDSDLLKQALGLGARERAQHFDSLRRDYYPRREFHSLKISVPRGREILAERLGNLGFAVLGLQ